MKLIKQQGIHCVAIFMFLLFSLSVGTSASAATVNPIQPMYVGVTFLSPGITISSSGTITCKDTVILKSGYSSDVTWELKRGNNGNLSNLSTWTASGRGELLLNQVRYASHGYSYQLKTTAKVYNSNGNYVETAIKYSSVVSY